MAHPATKRSVPYFVAEGAVHFRMSGTLTSLEDEDGRVLALLGLLDGRRETEQVVAEFLKQYPDATGGEVREAIADLDASGLLQDAADDGADFTAAHLARWSNNLGFFETYATLQTSKFDYQRRIRDARVAVLGVGGVGTHALIDLVAMGFTDIRIVDFDTVEPSNLNRQILYGEEHLGRHKVHVAAERARAMNSEIRLDVHQTRMMSVDDVYRMVHDRDIVIGSVDGPKLDIAHWMNEACVRAGTALISGGVEAQRALIYTIVPGVSGCVECWFDSVQRADPTSRMLQRAMREIASSGEGFGEDTAAFNGLVVMESAHMVGEVVRLATRVSPPLSVGRVLELSFHDPQLREVERFERDPDCAVCGGAVPAPALLEAVRAAEELPF